MDPTLLTVWMVAGTAFTLFLGGPWLVARMRSRALRAERARMDRQLPETVSTGKAVISGMERRWLETDGLAPGLTFRMAEGTAHPETWTDPGTGDPDFDRAIDVSGNMLLARALLDSTTRAEVRTAFADWGELRDGMLRLGQDEGPLDRQAARLLTLASRLRLLSTEETLARLVEIAQGDPKPLTRALCFDAFAARGPSGSARALARTLLTDTDPRVVVRAAAWLGEEAAEPLARLRSSGDPAIRALAVRGTARLRGAVGLLVAHQRAHGDLVAVTLALVDTGDPAAEAPLVSLLAVPGEVSNAAAAGLGEIGTARAIPPLYTTGTPEAKAAIARIQARIPDAGEGRVSMADGGGELSVSTEGGELSIQTDGGTLSMATLPEHDEPTEHTGDLLEDDETEVAELGEGRLVQK